MIAVPGAAGDCVAHVEPHPLVLLLSRLSRERYIRCGGGSNGRMRDRRLQPLRPEGQASPARPGKQRSNA